MLEPVKDRVRFLGRRNQSGCSEVFAQMDITVLPGQLLGKFSKRLPGSHGWGRGVVGSYAGGVEQLDAGKDDFADSAGKPLAIAEAVCRFWQHPKCARSSVEKLRERILSEYNSERIRRLIEESYHRAIQQRRAGSRN